MFSKQFPAKVLSQSLAIKKTRGGDEEQQRCDVSLSYDFTPKLAEAIGGDAPAIQEMLSADGGSDRVKMARAGLVLDCKEVKVTMKSSVEGIGLDIPRTMTLRAKVRQPDKKDTTPQLVAEISFPIGDDSPLSFLRANLGKLCKVRMDRRQLELIAGKEEPAEEPEPTEAEPE